MGYGMMHKRGLAIPSQPGKREEPKLGNVID